MNHIYAEKRCSFFNYISSFFGLSAIILFVMTFVLLPVNSFINIQLLTTTGAIVAVICMIVFDSKARRFLLHTEINESQYKELYFLGMINENIKNEIKNIMIENHMINLQQYQNLKKINLPEINAKRLIENSFM